MEQTIHLRTRAYAKLNLSLDISGLRDDGYHELIMVMQSASLYDKIHIAVSPQSDKVTASSNLRYVPNDERNLAVKAANLFFKTAGIRTGAHISMYKKIPVGSGMGGGSSDAAAVLRGLNQIFGSEMTQQELEALGALVGSDVPFCIAGGTQLATGRGEILKPLPDLPECKIVICKPDFSISTPELYHRIDSTSISGHPDTKGLIAALEQKNLSSVSFYMYNVFEEVPIPQMKTIQSIRQAFLSGGALGSIMTGSGSAVFGLFSDPQKADKTYHELRKSYRNCYLVKNQKSYFQSVHNDCFQSHHKT